MRQGRCRAYNPFPFHICLAFLVLLTISACKGSSETIQISLCQDGTIAPLVLLAQEKGYFSDEGLEMSFHPMGDGRLAMEGFVSGKCNAAVISEPSIVMGAASRPDFSIIATIGSSDSASRIVADRRKGITKASDLKGKRIGVRKGEISQLFLDMFLRKNNLRPEQVSIKFIEPQYLTEALIKGQIDAFSSTDIYLTEAVRRVAENALVLSEPGLCLNYSFLITGKSGTNTNPAITTKLLKALLLAEKRAAREPGELVSLISKRRELSGQAVQELLSFQRLHVSLQQPALTGLDTHLAFLLEQGQKVPVKGTDFISIIDEKPLKALAPEAVNL